MSFKLINIILLQGQLQDLSSLEQLLFLLFNPIILVPAIIVTVVLVKKNKEYKSGAYFEITKLPLSSVRRNTGMYGEYLIYKHLKVFESYGAKFLFNVYIPKDDGKTTEIDVLMICSKGVFVFESKNYSGWIFGSEHQKNWCQTLPEGRGRSHKEYFYNPIMQNHSHIKHLKAFLGEQVPMQSIISFSDRCTLKNIQIKNKDIYVINRSDVTSVVSSVCDQIPVELLSDSEITDLYNKLYLCTQVDVAVKEKHIANIHNNQNPQSASQTTTPDSSVFPIESIEPDIQKTQTLICPKCGGNLILRTARRGINTGNQFFGCSNYPKCTYTQNKTKTTM